ncbi:YceI family protein [Streptomyces catenulae]|uniref:YceI family protein n=1 Tax=Streptomyces catenulae TaxID=66875 RepID=A0ABV2YYZ9_9ACTN|nr:YceI family protein [Streptomyces catenulae]
MAFALLRRGRSDRVRGGAGIRLALPVGAGGLARTVTDPSGQPVDGAVVTVTAVTSRKVVHKGTTDPFGLFAAALPPGRYSLMVSVDSLQPHQESVEVTAGRGAEPEPVRLTEARALELPTAGTWLFDPPHTAIRFIARHVGMANVHGRFTRFEGGIRVGADMAHSHVEVRIDASSITTGNRTRDNHLRSADFLDVANYPYIHFTSNRFVHRGGSQWQLQGSLSMHGVSRSVALDTSYLGVVNGGYGQELRCAALAKAELHREDYTLNWRTMLARGIAVVGPTVKLELDVQAMYRSHDTPTPPE